MDIFTIAIQLEQEGAKFYEDLATKASTKGFISIFTILANDEKKHEKLFTSLQKNSKPIMVSTTVSEEAKAIFKNFKTEDYLVEAPQVSMYEKALEIEQKSIDLYSSSLASLEDDAARDIVKKIIAEEKKHFETLEELVTMVRRPHRWVEDAEFGVRKDY
ncbi:ferritin family protein [Sphaerochaeta sp. PS]|uniref:ferritin-like domain-containing protein n=1 Tax=Sphaerochaeta sp. PS TaxID=3076336 RepID=UPI0028A41177|nr:ferritin family protein [Sphaerochaeta sp. PS]MDT4761105.1 ferritin family protein [Sphaerochaeta sp. PS]